jgi:hypothetical protein
MQAIEVESHGRTFVVTIDSNPMINTDPYVAVFEKDGDEPLAVIHLNAGDGPHCDQKDHITVRR